MKILFIHQGREHLGIESLSSVLGESGHETMAAVDLGIAGQNDNIFSNSFLRKIYESSDAIIRKAVRYKPDVVCLSAYSTTLQWCFEIAGRIKEVMDVPTVIGGTHITLAPESAMLSPHIDFGVRGEAENVITELVEHLGAGESIKHLPGVISRENGDVRINQPAPLVEDIDSLPLPDKQLFSHAINMSDFYLTLTTRGCIFNCTYCCERFFKNLYSGQKFTRIRSVDSLIDELAHMKGIYNFKNVRFACSQFPPDKEWVADFAGKYSGRIGVPFWCFGHVKFFDSEYVALLKEAGCRNVNFGLQSISESSRAGSLRRHETNEDVKQALDICDRAGLGYDVDIMFHLPGEKEKHYWETIQFFSRFKIIHTLKIYNITLFPGTEMTEKALTDGIICDDEYNDICAGVVGDYFNVPMTEGKSGLHPQRVRAYRNKMRILPVLPARMRKHLLSDFNTALLGKTPEAFLKLISMARLLALRDPRLWFYLKLYARHTFRILAGNRIV